MVSDIVPAFYPGQPNVRLNCPDLRQVVILASCMFGSPSLELLVRLAKLVNGTRASHPCLQNQLKQAPSEPTTEHCLHL